MVKTPNINILYVEDDEIDRKAFVRAAKEKVPGTTLNLASSFDEAKKKVETQAFSLIISDHNLGDGHDVFEVLKISKHTPVIVVTGQGDENLAVSAMKAGAVDYIVKDENRHYLENIAQTIDRALEKQKLEQKIKDQNIEIQETNNKLLQTNKDLETFASAAGHDLKSPIATIALWAEAIQEEIKSKDHSKFYPTQIEFKK